MNRYRLARYRSGMTLEQAAVRSGVGRTTISRLENGHTDNPSAGTINALARTYGTTVDALVGADEAAA